MTRTRPLALLAAAVLGAAGTLTTGGAATAAPADGTGQIVGLVKEKGGDYLLDVNVEAVDRNGDVAASALTYESDVDAGQEGFFRLEVEPGRYTVILTAEGYVGRVLSPKVRVVEGLELNVGTVTMRRAPKPSRTSATLKDNRITATERAKVVVDVHAAMRPTGQITVKYGRKVVGTARLTADDRGVVRVVLDRLERGTYPLKAFYGGSAVVESSKSKELKLTVEKKRRHDRLASYRPNVRELF